MLLAMFDSFRLPDQFVTDKGEVKVGVLVEHLITTLVMVFLVLVIRYLAARAVRKNEDLPVDVRRRWLVALRNGAFLLILMGLFLIWSEEIKTVATYLLAIAVATVISLKELIQCITGGILRASSGAFKIGDRIEVAGVRGDVISYNMFTTTILEVGPGTYTHRLTGRSITLPNSIFLSKVVTNECFTDTFVLHVFKVPMKVEDDWEQAEKDLLSAAREYSVIYIEEARRYFNKLSKREGLVVLSVDPHVTFSIPAAGTLELVVRLAAPVKEKGKIEQAILRQFLMRQKDRATAAKAAVAKQSANGSEHAPPEESVA